MADAMEFPETFDEFAISYGFSDTKKMYTNGSRLIPVFRVKQWLEHISSVENKGEWRKMGEAYVCSRCSTTCACTETADKLIWHIDDKFCRGCGAMMDEKESED